MSPWPARAALTILLLLPARAGADDAAIPTMSAEDDAIVGVGTADVPIGYVNVKDPWIDRMHRNTFNAIWRSAMHVDQWFGATADEPAYMETQGSIAPSLLYDEFDGFQPRLRFHVEVPLPQLNGRFQAFLGRVNPDEYVTERRPQSGAFPRQYGPVEEDATFLGIRYRQPRQGSHFEANAGLRIRSPLDPFVKASYLFISGDTEHTMVRFRETAFWENSEKLGFTSSVDIERVLQDAWLLRWAMSGTISQRTEGVRGYTAFTVLRGLPNRQALAAELFSAGELDADVPIGDFGLKLAYRRSIVRDWLVLETRVSLTFPKDLPEQTREATWGVGVGLEMFFGTSEFLARPVTF